jgi:phosphoribosylformylglycinamidine synthase
VLDCVAGAPPPVDLERERRLQSFLIAAIENGLLASAHDAADGGLAVALAEACLGGPYAGRCLGARLDFRGYNDALSPIALLFGEDHGRAVISLPFRQRGRLARLARQFGVPIFGAGRVTGPEEPLELQFETSAYAWNLAVLRETYMNAIPRRMAVVATSRGEGA